MKTLIALIVCLSLSSAVFAQPAPDGGGRGGPPPGGPGGGQQDRPPRDGQGPDGGGRGGPGMRGPGGGQGPGMDGGPGGQGGPIRQFEILRGYLEVVDHYAKVSSDPTTAGIAAVVAAADVLRQRGPDAAIEYFTKILPDVKDASVARAIRAQLADLYKQSGQQDKALDQLHILITGSAAESDKH